MKLLAPTPLLCPASLLFALLVTTGPGCTRRVGESPYAEDTCESRRCANLEDCLRLLQTLDAPAPWTSREFSQENQLCAVHELRQMGPGIIPRLLPLLSHPDFRVQEEAVGLLSQMEQEARSVLPRLLEVQEVNPTRSMYNLLFELDEPAAWPLLLRDAGNPHLGNLACPGPRLTPRVFALIEEPSTPQQELTSIGRSCPFPREYLPRLRALLRRELSAPTLLHPPRGTCPDSPPTGCGKEVDGCAPRAAYVLRALGSYGQEGREALPEVMEALERGEPYLTATALRALAEFRAPEAIPAFVKALSTPTCRPLALDGLKDLGTQARPEATPALLSLLANLEDASERASVLFVFGELKDPAALAALRQALEASPEEMRAAAWALGGFGEQAQDVVPRLEELARTHESPVVRLAAATGHHRITGQLTAPAPPKPCGRLTRKGEDWELRLRSGVLTLRTTHSRRLHPLEGACKTVPGLRPLDPRVQVGEVCVHGRPASHEHPGFVRLWEKGRRPSLDEESSSPLRIFTMDGAVVVLNGDYEMESGRMVRLERKPEGTWAVTRSVPLPGRPVAHALVPGGELVVATSSSIFFSGILQGYWSMPPSCAGVDEHDIRHVVRITRDGRLIPIVD